MTEPLYFIFAVLDYSASYSTWATGQSSRQEFVTGGATFGKGCVGFGFMARTIFKHLLVSVGWALGLVLLLLLLSKTLLYLVILKT